MFENFLAELRADDPGADWTSLETVLHDIKFNGDELAVVLYDIIRWTCAQKQFPAHVRLSYVEFVFDRVLAPPDPPTLH